MHLDGYDQGDLFAATSTDKRREFFYWTDDGNLAGLRFDQYKVVFMEQAAHGLEVWMQPLVPLRAPKIFNLRSDPFERAEHEAGGYDRWFVEHAFVLVPAQAIVGQHLATFQEFPPRQKPGSFSVDQAMELMMKPEEQQLAATGSPPSRGNSRKFLRLLTDGGADFRFGIPGHIVRLRRCGKRSRPESHAFETEAKKKPPELVRSGRFP